MRRLNAAIPESGCSYQDAPSNEADQWVAKGKQVRLGVSRTDADGASLIHESYLSLSKSFMPLIPA